MESIYKQMNKIDDNESLNEKYNVRTLKNEGIFGLGKKKSKSRSNSSGDSNVKKRVTFKLYDHNGTLKFERTFTELPGKMSAEDQCKMAFKENSAYRQYCNNNPTDWTFERTSNPQDGNDTKRGRRYFVAADLHIPY